MNTSVNDKMKKDSLLDKVILRMLPPLGASVIRFLGLRLDLRTEGAGVVDALYKQGKHIIIAFWHGRQLMMPLAYRGSDARILISHHRDGELIQRIVAQFGFHSVRGSTTRGGIAALRQLIRWGRSGVDLVVTPDGPRGPRQVAQMGVIQLAKATGLPIVPLTFSCTKKNSFAVGINSYCPIRSAEVSSSGGALSGLSQAPRTRSLRPNGWSWKRR